MPKYIFIPFSLNVPYKLTYETWEVNCELSHSGEKTTKKQAEALNTYSTLN